MDDGLKQRLIGAIVLVSIGVIFIPGLLNKEGRREVDLTTQVPPEPVVMPRPLEIPDPIEPENIPPAKSPEDNYAQLPEVVNTVDEKVVKDDSADTPLAVSEDSAPEIVSGLDQDGVPRAWSVQVSSFESEKNATAFEQRLLDAGYTAYIRSSTANNVSVHRVFVGPKINRQTALNTKAEIDKAFKTQAMLVEFKP